MMSMTRRCMYGLVFFSLAAAGCADTERFRSDDDGSGAWTEAGVRTRDWGGPIGIQRPSCPGKEADITGTVYAPNGLDPVPGATVFVPSKMPEFFPPEVRCEVCGSLGTGYNFWTATTGADGRFSLSGVCPGKVNVFLQNGRFRRLVKVDVPDNGKVELSAAQSRLPRKAGEFSPYDSIPRIAVATGDFDKMECVLRKMGLEDFDFFEAARYLPNPAPKYRPFSQLLAFPEIMKSYNIIFINCTHNLFEDELKKPQVRKNIAAYVKAGGRLYVTDWSYDWIEQIESMSPFIDFAPGVSSDKPEPMNAAAIGKDGLKVSGIIKDPLLADWLANFPGAVSASGSEKVVPIDHFAEGWVVMRGKDKETKLWVEGRVSSDRRLPGYFTNEVRPLTVTFKFENCGKVLFSSYHTSGRDNQIVNDRPVPMSFPKYCESSRPSPQERILEFLIFDIARCIKPVG